MSLPTCLSCSVTRPELLGLLRCNHHMCAACFVNLHQKTPWNEKLMVSSNLRDHMKCPACKQSICSTLQDICNCVENGVFTPLMGEDLYLPIKCEACPYCHKPSLATAHHMLSCLQRPLFTCPLEPSHCASRVVLGFGELDTDLKLLASIEDKTHPHVLRPRRCPLCPRDDPMSHSKLVVHMKTHQEEKSKEEHLAFPHTFCYPHKTNNSCDNRAHRKCFKRDCRWCVYRKKCLE